MISLTSEQTRVVNLPLCRAFIEGPAGSGKTTAAIERLNALLQSGVPGHTIMIMVPQRTLGIPYYRALHQFQGNGSEVTVSTFSGLAQRMVGLFWPLIARDAGFAHPEQSPTFLTLENAQYFMASLVRPLLDQGFFQTVKVERARLYSQILDNLNKAALAGFPHTEIAERLKSSWSGAPEQLHVYDDVQVCVNQFREYCLQHNLLDFSLQIEVFSRYLWKTLLCREYLLASYRHWIVDNVEEDIPLAHDFLLEVLPQADSALVIMDTDAGFRIFLGADPESAARLASVCDTDVRFEQYSAAPQVMRDLAIHMRDSVERKESRHPVVRASFSNFREVVEPPEKSLRFFPQMLDWTVEKVVTLVNQGVPPGEIAILAPILSDALRFSLADRLERHQIPYRTHRPSRALNDEPAAQCLLTLARLAHPHWEMLPEKQDLQKALLLAIEDLDWARAHLLIEVCYRRQNGIMTLQPFGEKIQMDMRERITHRIAERYQILFEWLQAYAEHPVNELDFFFSRLFDEVLSRPGFGFHTRLDAAQVTANLIESVQKFRRAVQHRLGDMPLGKEYLLLVQEGVISALYLMNWQPSEQNAVFIAPAHTFLMNNYIVDYQFWLDIGAKTWYERIFQPLTHPIVLSRRWEPARKWTAEEEIKLNRNSLYRISLGLLRRCRKKVFIAYSDLNEAGFEQRGLLLKALFRVLINGGRRD
ncbi:MULTISPECIES: UvrD-helicase domain-containing protein [Anaerolinea]|uniref:UvrD-helicase domain-containing protein n=1 Tax=Anaerolinea TaxID=233189 RepID=UPI00261BB39F|nr:UvrD-helicase domain-containing protein [Anaerolinea thermophila]